MGISDYKQTRLRLRLEKRCQVHRSTNYLFETPRAPILKASNILKLYNMFISANGTIRRLFEIKPKTCN